MINAGKRNILGVLVDAVDYDAAVERIVVASRDSSPLAVSALAVHGVMTGVGDDVHRFRLNHLDLVVPDGQPVRWGLNLLYRLRLPDRVYGPELMARLCERAARESLPIYLYGAEEETTRRLRDNLRSRWPNLPIAGWEPSKFRTTTVEEKRETVARIRASGARITFVGLGCPRQEVFAHEYRDDLNMPVIAVGAAFPYHAGEVAEPGQLIQRLGLQWLYRLIQDPRRLWKRYLTLNPVYLALLSAQLLHLWRPDPDAVRPPAQELLYG